MSNKIAIPVRGFSKAGFSNQHTAVEPWPNSGDSKMRLETEAQLARRIRAKIADFQSPRASGLRKPTEFRGFFPEAGDRPNGGTGGLTPQRARTGLHSENSPASREFCRENAIFRPMRKALCARLPRCSSYLADEFPSAVAGKFAIIAGTFFRPSR